MRPIDWSQVACLVVVSRYTAGFQLHEAIATLAFHTTKWLAFTIPGTAFTDTIPLAGTVWSLPYEWLFYAFPPVALFCLHAVPPVPWLIFSLTAVVALTTLMPEVARLCWSYWQAGLRLLGAATRSKVSLSGRCLSC